VRAVVGRVDDDGVVVNAQILELLQEHAHLLVMFEHFGAIASFNKVFPLSSPRTMLPLSFLTDKEAFSVNIIKESPSSFVEYSTSFQLLRNIPYRIIDGS
jgi:hypothetical protein